MNNVKDIQLAVERAIVKIQWVHRKLFNTLKALDPAIILARPFTAEAFWNGDNTAFIIMGREIRVNYRAMPTGPADNRVPGVKIRVTFGQHKQPRFISEKTAGHNFEKLAEMVIDEAKWEIERAKNTKKHEQRMEIARGHAERLNKKFRLNFGSRPYVDIDDSVGAVLKVPVMTPGQIERVLELFEQMGLVTSLKEAGR